MVRRLVYLVVLATLHPAMADSIDTPIPCRTIQDCVVFSNTLRVADCLNGFCACKDGTQTKNCSSAEIMHQNTRNTGSPLSRGCRVHQDCAFNNSFCNTTISQCECQKDYVFSTNKKACLKKAMSIDFPCIEDKQCVVFLPNTTCQSGQCNCISGYHYAKNACYKTIDLGSTCTRSEECAHVDGAVCNETNICHCPAETVINSKRNKCLPAAREILNKCVEDVQCTVTFADSTCVDQVCQCQTQFHFESEMNQCYINRGLGETCGNTYECYQEENENVTTKAVKCMENVCNCAENFSKHENRCVNEGTLLVGSFLLIIATFAFSSGIQASRFTDNMNLYRP